MKEFSSVLSKKWVFPDYLDKDNFNQAVDTFHEALFEASNKVLAPKPPKPRPSFWFSALCRKLISQVRDKRRLSRLDPYNTERRKDLLITTNKMKRTIKLSKKLGAAEFASQVTHANVWRLNNWYRGKRQVYTPILKDPEGNVHVTPAEKADLMHNSWFSPPEPLQGNFSWEGTNANTREFQPVTESEIRKVLASTSNTSAPRSSGIGYKILKWAWVANPDEMAAIIKASIKLGIHHERWKSSLVVVIPKAKKPTYSDPKAWRPIQLLDCLGKLIEKIMAKRIIYEIGAYNLVPMEQFGGRSNSSCYDALITLTHDVQTAKKSKLVSSFLAVDVKGFFDHVHHDRLIKVLWDKGFCLETCYWTRSFATNRQAAIWLDDYVSVLRSIFIGLAQGSPISPTLACLYAAEALEKMIENPTYTTTTNRKDKIVKFPVGPRAYVDDHGLHAVGKNFDESNAGLNEGAEILVSHQ